MGRNRLWVPGSPGGAHHGGATHSSDTAVDTEVLRFVWGLHTNLSTTVSAILPSPLRTPAQYILVIYVAVAYPPHLYLPHVAFTILPHYSALCYMNRRLSYEPVEGSFIGLSSAAKPNEPNYHRFMG